MLLHLSKDKKKDDVKILELISSFSSGNHVKAQAFIIINTDLGQKNFENI